MRARAHATPPPDAVTFETGRNLLQEAAHLYNEHKAGRLHDDTARVRGYLLQTSAGILRTCELEKRLGDLEKTLARLESERGQLEHTFEL